VRWDPEHRFDILANGSVGEVKVLRNVGPNRRTPVFEAIPRATIFWRGKARYALMGHWNNDDVLDYGLITYENKTKGEPTACRIWAGQRRDDGGMSISEQPFYSLTRADEPPEIWEQQFEGIGGRTLLAWDWLGDGYQPDKIEFITAGPEPHRETQIVLMEYDPTDTAQPFKPKGLIWEFPQEPERRFGVAMSMFDFNQDGRMDLLVGYGGKYQQIDILYGKVPNTAGPQPPKATATKPVEQSEPQGE
jgi:hypothetical protein